MKQVRLIAQFPERAEALFGQAGSAIYRRAQPDARSPNEHVWDLVDLFPIFSEWLHMTRTQEDPTRAPADIDRLAGVWWYSERAIETALDVRRPAVAMPVQEAGIVKPDSLVMYIDLRDATAAGDTDFAAHEAAHRLFDVE